MTDILENRKFAVVTGASTGIGLELAKLFANDEYDLLIASENGEDLSQAAKELSNWGVRIETCVADLSTSEGVEELYAKSKAFGRPIDVLAANAGRGLGHAFIDQSLADIFKVINTNITGLVHLTHYVAKDMAARGEGKILITSSIAALMPGSYQAIYNATKAFGHSFSFAIRNELKDTGVSVTTLMPGPTETEFFHTADMDDTKVGQSKKDDPADVAKTGYDALMKGEGDVVHGLKNKIQAAVAAITSQTVLAQMHHDMAAPGTGKA
jgi:short-subunit dehydrogenase